MSGIFSNPYLTCAVLGWFVAQLIKGIAESIIDGKFRLERFLGSGGMPSSHSALVTALVVMIFLINGFDSAEFSIAAVFAFVTVYDAANVRYEVGEQAKIINQIIENWNVDDPEIRSKRFKEFIGHTKLEVAAGCGLGAMISVFYWYAFVK